jgi:hypothetical protein
MYSHYKHLTWFLCLVIMLNACNQPKNTTNLIKKEHPELPKLPTTLSITHTTPSATISPVDIAHPSPVKNQSTETSSVLAKSESNHSTSPAPPKTPKPTSTQTPTSDTPFGELAYFDPAERIFLTNLGQPGTDQLLFENTHTKYPDLTDGISWTPDGKKIAFVMIPWADIYLLTIGADDAINLTKTEKFLEMEPAISPNGKLIAFVSDRLNTDEFFLGIYTMRLDGSGVQLLYKCQENCSHPEWSPDGKKLVFQMGNDLYTIPASGGKASKIVSGAFNQYPTWSPDGQWIAFIRAQNPNPTSYIYLVKPDGSEIHAITDDTLGPRQLSWSPDSKFIAFENFPPEDKSGYLSIKVIHLQSGTVSDLTSNAYTPAWRPYDPAKLLAPTATITSGQADCSNGWTRLQTGGQAQVAGKPGDPPNRVRTEPNLNADQIGLIEPGTIVDLLEGPVCADGLVWWKIAHSSLPGGEGWTAEGDGKEYWLNPYK